VTTESLLLDGLFGSGGDKGFSFAALVAAAVIVNGQ